MSQTTHVGDFKLPGNLSVVRESHEGNRDESQVGVDVRIRVVEQVGLQHLSFQVALQLGRHGNRVGPLVIEEWIVGRMNDGGVVIGKVVELVNHVA